MLASNSEDISAFMGLNMSRSISHGKHRQLRGVRHTGLVASDTHSQSFLSSLFVLSGTRSLSRRLRRRSSSSISYDLFVRYFIIIIFFICRVFETLYLFLPFCMQFLFLPRHFCLYSYLVVLVASCHANVKVSVCTLHTKHSGLPM